ncbi:MAG: TerB family tellurite resistance protein [Catalinimonas sp.]
MTTQSHLLSGYGDREKSAYLGAVATLAMADSKVNEDEIEFLRGLGEGANLPAAETEQIIRSANQPSTADLRRDLDTLKNSELKYAFIGDVVAFAKSDGKYTQEEAQGIGEMATYLGLSQAQFDAVADFVDQSNAAGGSPSNAFTANGFDDNQFNNQLRGNGFADRFNQLGIPPNAMKALLTVAAPIVLGQLFKNRPARNPTATRGTQVGGGGLLGSLLGGFAGGQAARTGGGLGSLASILSGGRGYRSSRGGLLESVIGAVAGGPYQRRGF